MQAQRKKRGSGRPADLPDFSSPPLYELVLSIQFGQQIRNVDIGMIWRLFKKQYPKIEEQVPLTPVFEKFGLPPVAVEGPQFLLSTAPQVPRYWFVDNAGNELLQVQTDRLIHNWRKQTPEAEYPRYEPLRAKFKFEVERVGAFLKKEGLAGLNPNQCEVSYVNHISLGEDIEPDNQFDRIFTVWQEAYSNDYLKRIERGQFGMSYVIAGEQSEEAFGRLHVSAQPAIVRTTSRRIIQFTLTVRGKPKEDTVESAFQWLDKGRDVVVRSFASLTRKEMHQMWGRTDA